MTRIGKPDERVGREGRAPNPLFSLEYWEETRAFVAKAVNRVARH